jgi:hypothetical protein
VAIAGSGVGLGVWAIGRSDLGGGLPAGIGVQILIHSPGELDARSDWEQNRGERWEKFTFLEHEFMALD